MAGSLAGAQSLYKYRGENGEWIYADRPPADKSLVEVRELESTMEKGEISVSYGFVGQTLELVAKNDFYAPVELKLEIEGIRGLEFPDAEDDLLWVLPPRSSSTLLSLALLEDGSAPFLEYSVMYLPGDPAARHTPEAAYRAPYAIASNYPVSQAYPDIVTHTSVDSYYAVDFVMPIGTDIFAARGGVVFDVASSNFQAGLDPQRDGPNANVIRILHDDGTYAVYAHLNTNTIRVKPGDRVQRGEYIADSGNTGFSSGPHLHFAIMRNAGMHIESLPFAFAGVNDVPITPAAGMILTAY